MTVVSQFGRRRAVDRAVVSSCQNRSAAVRSLQLVRACPPQPFDIAPIDLRLLVFACSHFDTSILAHTMIGSSAALAIGGLLVGGSSAATVDLSWMRKSAAVGNVKRMTVDQGVTPGTFRCVAACQRRSSAKTPLVRDATRV